MAHNLTVTGLAQNLVRGSKVDIKKRRSQKKYLESIGYEFNLFGSYWQLYFKGSFITYCGNQWSHERHPNDLLEEAVVAAWTHKKNSHQL